MKNSPIIGLGGISATIIADSVSKNQHARLTTLELEYHRFIHSEFNTHRMFSRNAASSRAIPVAKTLEMVRRSPTQPIYWGKNRPGMQSAEELSGDETARARVSWLAAAAKAAEHAEQLVDIGLHKQHTGRILEPFQMIKVIVTATEFDNFFNLRNHASAQPEIQELAQVMLLAMNQSTAVPLNENEWHVPYYNDGVWTSADETPLKDALAISASCCAQVSYRTQDQSLDKARSLSERLVTLGHMSPFEHQATPICTSNHPSNRKNSWDTGVTHSDLNDDLWSANFRQWRQHRQMIPNNSCLYYAGLHAER